ncbi:MAG: DUF1501 domain-containing protein [Bacteroidia bacterium]|nr:DUF1501 domain-containing protein [Bacteroidia bacterium]
MKRRSFIQRTSAVTLPILMGGFPVHAFGRNYRLAAMTGLTQETDRVLILVQLNGGNDGLNTVLPLDQYSPLSAARANILIPESRALKLDDKTGLHPAMSGMHHLYEDQKLAIVQGAGYPDPNFSHFRSTDIWTTASEADVVLDTGWLGRYLDTLYPGFPEGYPNEAFPDPPAITIGSVVSATCQGPVANLGLALTDPDNVNTLLTGGTAPVPATPYGHELTFLRQTMLQTNQYITVIEAASQLGQNLSTQYPATGQNRLADQLKIVARLIAGGLKTRVYVVNLGGFDTHTGQVDTSDHTTGTHANLLQTLSDAIAAFQDDLSLLGLEDRVVGFTYSEFGRRIGSNSGSGTDHGAAAPLFVFGAQVNGKIFGENPVIPAEVSSRDNLPMQVDFRSVYASLLMDWFCVEEEVIRSVLFADFQHIALIKTSTPVPDPPFTGTVAVLGTPAPNPFAATTTIPFQTPAGHVLIQLFNAAGQRINTLTDQAYEAGSYEIPLDGEGLSPGVYYCRLQQGGHQMVLPLVKTGK